MNKLFKLLDKILDTFSDRYHCKKCVEKLGCEYCKAYGGHIANNKYNTEMQQAEFLSRTSFAIYISKVFERNVSNCRMIIVPPNNDFKEADYLLRIILKAKNDAQIDLFPISKLGNIFYRNDNVSLLEWYKLSSTTSQYVDFNAN
jgi:hypothetical protein